MSMLATAVFAAAFATAGTDTRYELVCRGGLAAQIRVAEGC